VKAKDAEKLNFTAIPTNFSLQFNLKVKKGGKPKTKLNATRRHVILVFASGEILSGALATSLFPDFFFSKIARKARKSAC